MSKTPTYVKDRMIGRLVASEIAYAGLSRQNVADAINLDSASLSRSIAGKRQWKASEIIAIAEHLDVGIDRLLTPRDEEPPSDPVTRRRRPPRPDTRHLHAA